MGPICPVPELPAPPAPRQWSQGPVPSHPFPDKGRGKPAFPWPGKKGFLQVHPRGSLQDSPLFLIPPGVSIYSLCTLSLSSGTSVIMVLPESTVMGGPWGLKSAGEANIRFRMKPQLGGPPATTRQYMLPA